MKQEHLMRSQEHLYLFHETLHKIHTPKLQYFIEILLLKFQYNNAYVPKIFLWEPMNRDLFAVESSTSKEWFFFLTFRWRL
jgi:hypothetical protein